MQWTDLQEEIDGLVSAIVYDIARERREAGDFLILVNRRQIGYKLRADLVEQGVEAYSFFHENALGKSPAAQHGFALLRLLVNEDDGPSLRVLLGLGEQTGRAKAYERLREAATDHGVNERQMLQLVADGRAKLSVKALVSRYEEARRRLQRLKDMELAGMIDDLFPEGDDDLSLLRELALQKLDDAEQPDDILEQMLSVITQPEVPQSPAYVRIMSLHKSKGLTSPVVIVVSALDGIIPTIHDDLPDQDRDRARAEQRRLFYVAITRSKDELIISSPFEMLTKDALGMGLKPQKMYKRGGDLVCRVLASPYLAELGPDQPESIRGETWLADRTGSGAP